MKKIIIVSLKLALICWIPLLLYIVFGPADGNPIGLGLLAWLSFPIAIIGICVGLIWFLFDFFLGPRR